MNGNPGEPSAGNDGPACILGTITLESFAGGGIQYEWSGPNGFTSNNQNETLANVQLADAGLYTVTITNQAGCTAVASTLVEVDTIPVVSIADNCIPDTIYTTDSPVPLTDCGQPTGGSFECNGSPCTEIDPAILGIGEHTITYFFTDDNNCSGAYSTTFQVTMPNSVFDPHQDRPIAIFPNPTDRAINIQVTGFAGESTVQLFNTYGQLIRQREVRLSSRDLLKMDLHDLPKGIFWLVIQQEEKMIAKKVVLQ